MIHILPRNAIHFCISFTSTRLVVSLVAEVWLGSHHADSVGVTHTTPPSLHAHNLVALSENAEIDGVLDTPLEATVDVLLPWRRLEVGLLLRE